MGKGGRWEEEDAPSSARPAQPGAAQSTAPAAWAAAQGRPEAAAPPRRWIWPARAPAARRGARSRVGGREEKGAGCGGAPAGGRRRGGGVPAGGAGEENERESGEGERTPTGVKKYLTCGPGCWKLV